jgi:adenylate cyclase
MNSPDFKRKLTAVFSADVVGYSRLMGEDEAATVTMLEASKQVIFFLVKEHQGRIIDSPGDNILVEFSSVVNAVECAVAIQKELKSRNAALPEDRRMEFRIGINLGDVIEKSGRIYGDGVNIAARIESLAESSGICISGSVYEQVEHKLPLSYEDMGYHHLKNIVHPIHVYRVSGDPLSSVRKTSEASEPIAMPSIAVMPFANLSDDSEQKFFSNGITEEIITSLSRTPKLFIIDSRSTVCLEGNAPDFLKIGRNLGVQYILMGSVRKAGNRIRVNTQLINTDRGEHLWAERYDRELKDIFALQDEITLRITQALQIKLTEGEQACIYGKGTENLDAYLNWLQGQDLLIRGDKDDYILARKKFEDAIRCDPNWAQPYTLLGWICLLESLSGRSSSSKPSFNQAIHLGMKSLSLDDTLPGPHGLMSQIYLYKRQHDAAIAEAQKAVALGPCFAFAHTWLGTALMFSGRFHEAGICLQKAIRLNLFPPAYWIRELGETYRMAEQYKEAVTQFKRAIRVRPRYLEAYVSLACTFTQMGSVKDAEAAASEILKIAPFFSVEDYTVTLPYKEEKDLNCVVKALYKAGLK